MKDQGLFRFDEFRADPRNRLLEKAGTPIRLAPKVFETLVLLLKASPNAVSRAEMRAALWPDMAVEESLLAQNVYSLRKALGTQADGRPYIETLPKLGYRFTADVQTAEAPAAVAAIPAPRWRGWKRLVLAGGALLLASTLIATLRRRPHLPPAEAVRQYQLGMAIWKQRRGTGEDEHAFRDATRIDPLYANAHAGLAAALAFHAFPAEGASEEAARAIALDGNLSLPYAVRGFFRMVHGWDWAGAEADLRQATALGPGDATAAQWYALLLAVRGRTAEGLRVMDAALGREPDSANLLAEKCDLLYFERRYAAAREACEAALRVNPGFLFARQRMIYVHAMNRDWEDALQFAIDVNVGGPGLRRQVWEGRFLQAMERDRETGFWRGLRVLFEAQGSNPYYLATVDAQSGDREAALADVERAVAGHAFMAFTLGAEPALESLHGEPRFQAACRTVGVVCR